MTNMTQVIGPLQTWIDKKTRRLVYVQGASFGFVTVIRCSKWCTKHRKTRIAEHRFRRQFRFLQQSMH